MIARYVVMVSASCVGVCLPFVRGATGLAATCSGLQVDRLWVSVESFIGLGVDGRLPLGYCGECSAKRSRCGRTDLRELTMHREPGGPHAPAGKARPARLARVLRRDLRGVQRAVAARVSAVPLTYTRSPSAVGDGARPLGDRGADGRASSGRQ